MWTLLLGAVEPYLLWIKLGIVTVVLACSFWAGVKWESGTVNALLLKQERMTREWQEAATAYAQKELDAQLARKTEADRIRLAVEKKAELARAIAMRNAYEFWTNNPAANVLINPGAVRLWRTVNGEVDTIGAAKAPAAGGTVDAVAGRCALADLHSNHEQLVNQYRIMSRDLMELQTWARDALALCNAPPIGK